MKKQWDVLGLGVVAVDDLIYVGHYPAVDSKLPIITQRREGGGLTGTALVAAARLGATTAYYGVLGDNELSQHTLTELETEGINCKQVLINPGVEPVHAYIIIDQSTGQRTIFFSFERFRCRLPEEIEEEIVASCKVLFVDHSTGLGGLKAVGLAHLHGIQVIGDFEQENMPYALDLMREIDHLIISIDFGRKVTGKTDPDQVIEALWASGRACVVVTNGSLGSWFKENGGKIVHIPAVKVNVVDTTGCGDVFHGAYAACLSRGESISRAIRVATVTAGIKAAHPGGRSGIPNLHTVEDFIKFQNAY
jgi:ribokinase